MYLCGHVHLYLYVHLHLQSVWVYAGQLLVCHGKSQHLLVCQLLEA